MSVVEATQSSTWSAKLANELVPVKPEIVDRLPSTDVPRLPFSTVSLYIALHVHVIHSKCHFCLWLLSMCPALSYIGGMHGRDVGSAV